MSYSQEREEAVIRSYFNRHGIESAGTFLDIGANDGRTFSNTYALSLAGWSGLCVDASPVAFDALKATHGMNQSIQLIHAAITTKDGPVEFHESSDTLVSSLDASHREQWASYGFDWTKKSVDGITFATMMNRSRFKTFDFISIDAEGHDIEILSQMDLDAIGCQCICIEHSGRIEQIKAMVPQMKQLWLGGINMILAR